MQSSPKSDLPQGTLDLPGMSCGLCYGKALGMILMSASVGIAGASVAGRLLQRLMAGMQPTDPLAFAAMICVLLVTTLFASFLPACRASRIDPMSALRLE